MATEYVRGASVSSEDGEETFVDAAEDIVPSDDEGGNDDDSITDPGPIGTEHRGEDMDLEGSEAGDGEVEQDLFESTFGGKTVGDTDDENDTPSKDRFVADEHSKGCNSIRGPPTPPADTTLSAFVSNHTAKPLLDHCDHAPPDLQRDRSWALRRLERFHLRAIELIPHLPLQPHRYWIGVLSTTKTTENFKAEKDFVWFKGHRKTTVQTIWHFYQQSTATEAFTLLLGHEKVEFKDIMQELDYFNDKKVILRAVPNKHPDAKGRRLTAGIAKMDAEPVKKKKVQAEVIVLDDED